MWQLRALKTTIAKTCKYMEIYTRSKEKTKLTAKYYLKNYTLARIEFYIFIVHSYYLSSSDILYERQGIDQLQI